MRSKQPKNFPLSELVICTATGHTEEAFQVIMPGLVRELRSVVGKSIFVGKDGRMYPTENPTEDLIRAAREKFNIAIAEHDVQKIRSLLMQSYHIVTGRSEQSHGAEEEARRWASRFEQDRTVFYRRTPREISINEDWGLAEELGNWRGNYTVDEILVHVSGVYAAKWQRATNGEWLLQAEMFTTITCTGPQGGCPPPEPITK